ALKKQLDENLINFLALIAENKKMLKMPEIEDQFESIKYIHNNGRVADVTLAYATVTNVLDSLTPSLETQWGCTLDG
ncbi:F0F1 ATP synthase subunit delta, partial [Francisella tularensis subsp. holarctica]|uniref:F0F1 ATP synthase subunit delta n=1 Tax=Francisella tularensis TaxID=263 RepID=UPI002381AB07